MKRGEGEWVVEKQRERFLRDRALGGVVGGKSLNSAGVSDKLLALDL
jgi:hypothetical protein